jgi:hypothetical protein
VKKTSATDEQTEMRTFIRSLASAERDWIIVGRSMYWRGQHGVFRLDIDEGSGRYVHGVVCVYTPNNGGEKDRNVLSFQDLLVPTNPTNNTNYAGDRAKYGLHVSVEGMNRWTWCPTAIIPASLRPLHDAIDAWVTIWNAPHGRKQ